MTPFARIGLVVIFVFSLTGCSRNLPALPVHDKRKAYSGGDTTVFNESQEAFSRPAANLPPERLRDFAFGNRLFNTNWVTAPSSTTGFDGLGPTFNRNSCSACHFKDGRGRPPQNPKEPMNSMLIRISLPEKSPIGGPQPHPHYGDQINDRAVLNVPVEGKPVVTYSLIDGRFPDGEVYSLQVPSYELTELNFGPLDGIQISPRVANAVFGLGLLEAVTEKTILSFADPLDQDKDGISGRPNYVYDFESKTMMLGRFGWKANQPSLRQQDASALVGDIGITNPLFTEQNCPEVQTDCRKQPAGGSPEMSAEYFEKLNFYVRTLAVPARRNLEDPEVIRGEQLFMQARCDVCHIPTMKTGKHMIPQLAHQTIHPYTDLLLHDMGPGLADNRPEFEATGQEWRTPPLWGIGLVEKVNKHTNFLHDGRARNLTEAILWHDGEARSAKEAFRSLSKEDRQAMIRFLESL